MAALESGEWDIVCSTPEFIQFTSSASRARKAGRRCWSSTKVTISTSRSTARRTRSSPEMLPKLGMPQVLALTATATDDAFAHIRRELGIDAWVIDPTIRENLHVVDARNIERRKPI